MKPELVIIKGENLALEEAEKSLCKKRKVGVVILDCDGFEVSKGHNHIPFANFLLGGCEDKDGNTYPEVVHAEIAAIQNGVDYSNCTIFVTHQPCKNCQRAIDNAGLKLHLVEQFMKFDTGKLRYSLIPPVATEALAKVLTYGAKKYKPNNWQKAEDFSRYTDALYRHLEAWRGGQEFDEESGLSHLSHALTNVAFLLWYETNVTRPLKDNRNVSNID